VTRTLVLLVGVLLLAVGCSGPSRTQSRADASPTLRSASPTTAGPTTGTASPTPASSPTHATAPPAPPRSACYRLSTAALTRPTSSERPVSCRSRHTARTVYVGTLDTTVDGHAVAVDSATVQRQLARTCPRELRSYVGGDRRRLALSRLNVVWYSPTLAQSDAGADWFRCDLVAFARGDSLLPLPEHGTLRGVLQRSSALDTYGLCGTAAPGAGGFERVICGRAHSWRAVDVIDLAGGAAYPGRDEVRQAGDSRCKDEVRARAQDPLKFQYGWEWPTRAQWGRGQHFGYCWAPG
jgi:hypothetical protein